MRGQWPSGWEDPEDEELDTEVPDEETEVRLSEVAAFLATVPAPALPGAIESRIVAALAAESAARAADLTTDPAADLTTDPAAGAPGPDRSRTLGPAPARARVRRFRGLRPAQVSGALAACLLFVGLGFAISLSHGPSSSSSAAGGQAASSASASGKQAYSSPGYAEGRRVIAGSPAIVVVQSGTTYQGATLAGQVRAAIHAQHFDEVTPAAPAVPSASSSSAAAPASSAPAAATAGPQSSAAAASSGSAAVTSVNVLRGCVLKVTGGAAPLFVDKASYQGTPAYVIATASQVWVVGLDCTQARPDVITSASLAS